MPRHAPRCVRSLLRWSCLAALAIGVAVAAASSGERPGSAGPGQRISPAGQALVPPPVSVQPRIRTRIRPRPSPTPAPSGDLGVIETTNLVFTNVLPLLGTSLPPVETLVATVLASGLDPVLAAIAAEDPATRTATANGIALDFGEGTQEPVGTLAGRIDASYSGLSATASGFTFSGAITSTNFTINGLKYPITSIATQVTASKRDDGTATMDLTLSGTGPEGATASGTVKADTAKCKKYPVGGSILTTVGPYSARIVFNDRCNGTFGFNVTGSRQFRFNPAYYNCYYYGGSWYTWGTLWLVGEKGRLALDNSDDEPYNMTLEGSADDSEVHITFKSLCRRAACDTLSSVSGTFDGHFWKAESSSGITYRRYVGTLTSTYLRYNADGSVYCEATRVLTEQDGMNDAYDFYEVTY
jgi:hypothetical protein